MVTIIIHRRRLAKWLEEQAAKAQEAQDKKKLKVGTDISDMIM